MGGINGGTRFDPMCKVRPAQLEMLHPLPMLVLADTAAELGGLKERTMASVLSSIPSASKAAGLSDKSYAGRPPFSLSNPTIPCVG
jgi:hypothetical protein